MQRQLLGVIGVRFDVLGPMQLVRDGEATPVSGAVRQHLLAMLLVRANRSVPAEVLADALWDGPGDAATRLYVQVHRLRGILDGPERLVLDASGYRLCVPPDASDAGRFDALVDEAADQAPGPAAETLREALALWRGEPYAGVDLPRVAEEARRLSEGRLDALEALYTAELHNGRHAAITSELGEVVHRHPLRERLHVLLMTALHRSGRRADALAAYRDARNVLVNELGLEPGPELQDVERAVLDGAAVDLDGPTAPAAVPAQLPQRPAGFVGRAAQLSALDGLLRPVTTVGVMAVVGGGGVGKTSLVLSWAHRAKDRFPDGQLYVDLRGYGPDSAAAPGEVLAAFLRALGVDASAIPEDPAERAARFRTLANGRRMLIVLDNAASAEQVRPLLPGADTCRVVVTSRDSLGGLVTKEGVHRIHLERMSEHEAVGLLSSVLGGVERSEPEPELVAELARRCAGLPLALRIAAERLRDRPDGRIGDLVDVLSDAPSRLDVLDSGDDDTSVRAVFAASYRHLPPSAARLLRLFGIHPGHDIDDAALAALAGTDRRTTRRLLDTLVRAHLVEECGGGRYALHDLLWIYAADLAALTDSAEERRVALGGLLDHYRQSASRAAAVIFPDDAEGVSERVDGDTTDFDTGMRWLESERVNLMRAMEVTREVGRPEYVTELSRLLTWFLDSGGYPDDARVLHTEALGIARETGDRAAEGTALRGLGLLDFRTQRYADSAHVTEEALSLHLAAGAKLSAATNYNCLGVLYGFMSEPDAAVEALQSSIELYRSDDRGLLMACRPLVSLGLQQRRLCDFGAARRTLTEAHALATEADLLITRAHAAYGLAGVHCDLGSTVEALDFGRNAMSLAQQAHFTFLVTLAQHRLGGIHTRRREFDEAAQCHGAAVVSAQATGNTQLQLIALNGMGASEVAAGRSERASDSFRAALAAADGRGAHFEQARAHSGLGDALERLGERDQAIDHWQRALDLFRAQHAREAEECEAKLAGLAH